MIMRAITRWPTTLYSYLATEMLAPFFASFLVMNGVFFLIRLIPFLNFALDLDIGSADFIRLFSYMLPKMMLYTIPMSAMMGVIICFSRLSNDTEILAMKAGGISIYHILPPLIVVASTIAFVTGYVSISLIPKSEVAMKQLTYQLLKEKVDKGIKEYQFTEALGDLVVHVGEIDRATGDWKDVWVSDMRGQQVPAITMASSGRMVSDLNRMTVTILLENGSLHRPEGLNAQIVHFSRYVIDIPLQLPGMTKEQQTPRTLQKLLQESKRLGLDEEPGRDMLVEFHKRFVLPVGCLVMAMLGLPLGLLAGPGKKAIGIPLGLLVFVFYFVLFSVTKNMAEDGVAPIALLMWLPNICFFLYAIYAINRVALEQSILPSAMTALFTFVGSHLVTPLMLRVKSLAFRLFVLVRGNRDKRSLPAEDSPDPQEVLGDPEFNICHFLGCSELDHHCTVRFDSADEAIDAGFSFCNRCRKNYGDGLGKG